MTEENVQNLDYNSVVVKTEVESDYEIEVGETNVDVDLELVKVEIKAEVVETPEEIPKSIKSNYGKTKGLNWGEEETRCFLQLCINKHVVRLMNSKKYRYVDIFKRLVPDMNKKGFKKTAEQMKLKLKKLKQEYNKNGSAPTRCPFYNELDLLYGLKSYLVIPNSQGIDTTAIIKEQDVLLGKIEVGESENKNTDGISSRDTTPVSESIDEAEDVFDQSEVASCSSNDQAQNSTHPKRRRLNSKNRKTYNPILNEYASMIAEKQASMVSKLFKDLIESQNKAFREVMIEQRIWQREMLRKEHEFQREQTEKILNTFVKCVEKLKGPTTVQPVARISVAYQQPGEDDKK